MHERSYKARRGAMKINPKIVDAAWRSAVILLPVTILALITFGFAQAAFYSINTDDNSIAEWIPPDPQVPVFLTDPDDDAGQ